MGVLKTEAIGKFLEGMTHPDLASLYHSGMECQVNVAQGIGNLITGEYKGSTWKGYTDGVQTWKPIRIPWKANTAPEYEDSELKFDFSTHVKAIGMTGWDWQSRVSRWIGFDFDSIIDHTVSRSTLTEVELEEVKQRACEIPWVTVRRSTGGRGLHLYVFLHVETANHNEHAALARAVLSSMSLLSGFDFEAKVDCCGAILWVWRRGMEKLGGLELIKQGEPLVRIPPHWKDHLEVVSGRQRRNIPSFLQNVPEFTELSGQLDKVQLDSGHNKLLDWLKENESMWWWDSDHHMLVTHTAHLKDAFDEISFIGIFRTVSLGREKGADHNCFLFPMRHGAWSVRRYSKGAAEDVSWDVDASGWTFCYFNKAPTLKTVAKAFEAVEDLKNGFVFREATVALEAAKYLGISPDIPAYMMGRGAILRAHKDGRIIFEIEKDDRDDGGDMTAWLPEKKIWRRLFNSGRAEQDLGEVGVYDDLVRHLVYSTGSDAGWTIRSEGTWKREPLTHITLALSAMGHNTKDTKLITGSSIFKCWTLVNIPFEEEYPGNRRWNMGAAQLRFAPTQNQDNLQYPTWKRVLSHTGSGLDLAVSQDPWCKSNGVLTGGDYLKCWVASLFQFPSEPLPYLFFYGPEDSGKSIFCEALALLMTSGCMRADTCLTNPGNFNGELANAVLCYIEETNLQKSPVARNRIKDWVTSPKFLLHEKNQTPFLIDNTMHWVQCSNEFNACPVFPGDTRITMSFVDNIDPLEMIPKRQMIVLLEKEASDFLAEILNLEIPESGSRLNLPVIDTDDKAQAATKNTSLLDLFIKEECFAIPGTIIKASEFYQRFRDWLDPAEISYWTSIMIGKKMPPQFPKGRQRGTGQLHFGNITFTETEPNGKWVFRDDYLEHYDVK